MVLCWGILMSALPSPATEITGAWLSHTCRTRLMQRFYISFSQLIYFKFIFKHRGVSAHECWRWGLGNAEALLSLEPDFQVVLSYWIWVLRTELRSYERAVHTFDHWAVSPVPKLFISTFALYIYNSIVMFHTSVYYAWVITSMSLSPSPPLSLIQPFPRHSSHCSRGFVCSCDLMNLTLVVYISVVKDIYRSMGTLPMAGYAMGENIGVPFLTNRDLPMSPQREVECW